MTLGPLMVDLEGESLTQEEHRLLGHPLIGGVVLFSRNFTSFDQLAALTRSIHAVRQPGLLIAVDQEGGRVQRFREGFTQLPALRRLGQVYDGERGRALEYARATGWLMATELRSVGIDFSFAPVLDLDRGISGVIGDRAFHGDPDVVADLGQAYASGMRAAGMAVTAKHFPGHGSVRADSHLELPVDERRPADLFAEDMRPFERLMDTGLTAIMMAHVVYSRVDARPASLSARWIRGIVREELGFQGAVFSDDLSMAGAASAGGPVERARAALEAGCDMILVCNDRPGVGQILDDLADFDDPAGHLRLARMHGRGTVDRVQLPANVQWRRAVELVREYDPEPLLGMDME